jgi:hypothetical protein
MAIDKVLRKVLDWVNSIASGGNCVKSYAMDIWKMNEQIKQLAEQALQLVADEHTDGDESRLNTDSYHVKDLIQEKFAELIVRECCLALWTEECHTSDLAFDEVKRNATRIKEHFGIDPNEITEDMLSRSIKWMEQQLEDKKHFGVEE